MRKGRKVMSGILAGTMVAGSLAPYTGTAVIQAKAEEVSQVSLASEDADYLAYYPLRQDYSDVSGNNQNGEGKGNGASFDAGYLQLPGGANNSGAGYVQLPTGMMDGQNTVSISVWLKNETGSGNYSALYFGTAKQGNYPLSYWLLNPANPDGRLKSVFTNSVNAGAPWGTEYGISATNVSQGTAGPVTDNGWNMYTTVITANQIEAFYNLDSCGTANLSRTVSDFGSDLLAYIGRSSYDDIFYKGGVKELKIYNGVISQEQMNDNYYSEVVDMAKDSLTLDADAPLTDNLDLPASVQAGKAALSVTWVSNDEEVITNKGAVNRGAEDKTAKLTATISAEAGGKTYSARKEFDITVAAVNSDTALQEAYDALNLCSVTGEDLKLPATGKNGTQITWTSSDTAVMGNDGTIQARPKAGEGNKEVTLKAVITYGGAAKEKVFKVTILEEYYGYVMGYVTGNNDLTGSLHLAVSTDGKTFTALNSNSGILFPTIDASNGNRNLSTGIRFSSPWIFRKTDGTFGVTSAIGGGSKEVYLYDSEDLITYTGERRISTNTDIGNVTDTQCYYDTEADAYRLNWTSNGVGYSNLSTDLATLRNPGQRVFEKPDFTGISMPKDAVPGNILPLTKAEYEKLTAKFTRVTNTGVSELSAITTKSAETLEADLPKSLEAAYSDGTTGELGITWNLDDYDLEEAGTYTIEGTVDATEYQNPLIEQRADPHIKYDEDSGYYYFTASYPAFYDIDHGYDRIILRRSKTIEGLAAAEEITIWNAPSTGQMAKHVWAPEIHKINGRWYVFFAAGNSNAHWAIRPYVLVCQGDDPYNVENWKQADGTAEIHAATSEEAAYFKNMSLDMTYFEHNGKHYVIWADIIGQSTLYMQEIDPDQPWTGKGKVLKLTEPVYAWERNVERVNEGATILKSDDRIFITFSAAGTGPEYCIGMLYADTNADLMDAASWTKLDYPVLTSADVPGEYGPGHNSFTVDEEGNAIFVYHARSEECYNNQCQWASAGSLYDPCRHARVKRVHWSEDGFPILNTEERSSANRKVSIQVTIQENTAVDALPETILEYRFDEKLDGTTVKDTAGNNNATLSGGASYAEDKEKGQVLYLDGNAGYLEFPKGFFDNRNEMTVSMDINAVTRNGNFFTFTYGKSEQVYSFLKTLPKSMRMSVTTSSWGAEQTATATFDNSNNSRRWMNVTMVVSPSKISLYQDGKLLAEKDVTIKTSDLGSDLLAYLGKSFYSGDKYFKGYFDNVKVYDQALDAKQVRRAYQKAQAEAEAEKSSLKNVSETFAIPNSENIKENITLPGEINGVSVSWSSSDEKVISTVEKKNADYDPMPAGVVTRQTEDQEVTLTAVFTKGDEKVTKTYKVTVKAKPEELTEDDYVGYLFVHFTGHESSINDEQVYFSISQDGMNWEKLNNGQPVLKSVLGEGGVRDHYILRAPEGDKFYMIATDLSIYTNPVWMEAGSNGSTGIIVWESEDLVNWSEPRLEVIAPDNAGCTWAPEIIYDELTGEYVVYWSSTNLETDENGTITQNYENHKIWYAKTRDFHTFTEPKVFHEGGRDANGTIVKVIDSTMIKDGDTYYRYTKNESQGIIEIDKSSQILGTYTKVPSGVLDNLKSSIGAVEGPIIFKFNKKDTQGEDKWCLMVDRFAQGKGYCPLITSDLESGEFTMPAESEYSMPGTSRHGYVISITGKEYKALQSKWNTSYTAPDTSKLEAVIAEAEAVDADAYTKESYDALQAIWKEAKKVCENALEQQEIDAAQADLEAALVALVKADRKLPYKDVEESDWFYDAVAYNYYSGLMTGVNEVTFAPSAALNRAQAVVILWRIAGKQEAQADPEFPDVSENEWYTDAVVWAVKEGVVSGYSDGRFGPEDAVTREQMAVMLWRFAKSQGYDVSQSADLDSYKDADQVSEFAVTSMQWAIGNEMIQGKAEKTMLDPQGSTNRSECAVMIQRFMNVYAK